MNITTSENQTYFRTADLALTAALCVLGFSADVERNNPNRVIFIFKNHDNLADVIGKYWRSELSVEPQAYFNQLKIIKTRIYQH